MGKLLAFHDDPKLKESIVSEIKWHQEQDKIIQGTYGSNGKYCAVGCAINSLNRKCGKNYSTNDHKVYETEFGIPQTIARLEDRIFEGLEAEEAKTFPLKFMNAIQPGADLSLVTAKFMVWLLSDKKHGVMQYAREDGKVAIERVVKLYKRVIAGETVKDDEWANAARAAADAAYAAADAANAARAANAAAYAAYAARAAANAARAAADAAYAAADAANAAAYAARAAADAAFKQMSKKLISLLKSAPVN
jgi:hypothetical protein